MAFGEDATFPGQAVDVATGINGAVRQIVDALNEIVDAPPPPSDDADRGVMGETLDGLQAATKLAQEILERDKDSVQARREKQPLVHKFAMITGFVVGIIVGARVVSRACIRSKDQTTQGT